MEAVNLSWGKMPRLCHMNGSNFTQQDGRSVIVVDRNVCLVQPVQPANC